MKQKQLRFTVDGQEIRARPVTVVADSRNYLVAEFVFSGDWEGLEKPRCSSRRRGWSITSWCRTEPVPYRRR